MITDSQQYLFVRHARMRTWSGSIWPCLRQGLWFDTMPTPITLTQFGWWH